MGPFLAKNPLYWRREYLFNFQTKCLPVEPTVVVLAVSKNQFAQPSLGWGCWAVDWSWRLRAIAPTGTPTAPTHTHTCAHWVSLPNFEYFLSRQVVVKLFKYYIQTSKWKFVTRFLIQIKKSSFPCGHAKVTIKLSVCCTFNDVSLVGKTAAAMKYWNDSRCDSDDKNVISNTRFKMGCTD